MGASDALDDDPRLGERVGSGASCQVYAWEPGLVVKVYRSGFEHLAEVEAERAHIVHAAGVPCPAVHGLVEVSGRPGLIFERIDGRSAMARPDAVLITARVHAEMHEIAAPTTLPRLVDTFAELGIHNVPDGDCLFHGDLHPANLLEHGSGWSVIDWQNAHRAAPAADVACAVLTIGYRGLRPDRPNVAAVHRYRVRAADSYLSAYAARRPDAIADLRSWTRAIGNLLLEREPETAFADELRRKWILD